MSTIAVALQSPALAVAETAGPPALAAGGDAGEDFILALTQALSSAASAMSAPLTRTIAQITSEQQTTSAEAAANDQAAAASLAGMLVLPWAPPLVAAPAGNATNPLQLLGATSGSLLPKLASTDAEAGSALMPAAPTTLLDAATGAERTPSQEAGALLNLTHRPSGTPAFAADAPATVQTSVGSSGWPEELGTRLTLMAQRGQHSASLRLSPEHLGPLEIHIEIRDDQASVWFGAAHADTRAAIEHALPRLRELFAAQGMTLTDAGVSQESPRERLPTPQQPATNTEAAAKGQVTLSTHTLQRSGLIDAYA